MPELIVPDTAVARAATVLSVATHLTLHPTRQAPAFSAGALVFGSHFAK